MKKLPIEIQTFSEIYEENYNYIDKTKYIYKLTTEGKAYFLSRPRKFGKSLLLSTIDELFKGNKSLFEGLYIYDKWDWEKSYSVIYLDLSGGDFRCPEQLENSLEDMIMKSARELEVSTYGKTLNGKFTDLIFETYKKTGEKVVVLIDNYDKPILDNIFEKSALKDIYGILDNFYNIIKSNDKYIKFIFITGILNIQDMSIFNLLSNIKDITFDTNFSDICGFTDNELQNNFKTNLKNIGEKLSLSKEDTLKEINIWYGDYCWDGENSVSNPISILKLFEYEKFSNYWFETATSEFVKKLFEKSDNYDEIIDETLEVEELRLKRFKIDYNDFLLIFFQTGYMTIDKKIVRNIVNNEFIYYNFKYPNLEVSNSLIPYFAEFALYERKFSQDNRNRNFIY